MKYYISKFLHLEAGIWGFSAEILINRMYCSTLCASYLVSKLKCLKACDESKTFLNALNINHILLFHRLLQQLTQ